MDENIGKLAQAAAAHRDFLRKRKMAQSQGISYPQTRTSQEIAQATPAPGILGGLTGFSGMGSRMK